MGTTGELGGSERGGRVRDERTALQARPGTVEGSGCDQRGPRERNGGDGLERNTTRRGLNARGIGMPSLKDAVLLEEGLHRRRHEELSGRSRYTSAVILVYAFWVISAFVTFSGNTLQVRERKRGRLRGGPTQAVKPQPSPHHGRPNKGGGARGRMIVAPPIIGRRRYRRRRPWTGMRQVVRLTSAATQTKPPRGRTSRPRSRRRQDRACARRHRAGMRRAAAQRGREDDGVPWMRQRTMAEACAGAMGTLNVGQATNPGPAGTLRWISTMAASVLKYPSPRKMGFHGSHTVGHLQPDRPPVEP